MTTSSPVPAPLRPLALPGEFTSVFHRLQHVAAALPERIALTGPSGRYTYSELMRAVDEVARELLTRLGEDDAPVGVLMSHDTPAVVTLLGLARIDRVFINLDPAAPADRTASIVSGSAMRFCIADKQHADALKATSSPVEVLTLTGAGGDVELPEPRRAGADAAYLAYTSGSTGKPKGVIETHLQTLSEAVVAQEIYEITPADEILPLFPLAFVAGMSYLFSTLLAGAGMHLVDARTGTVRQVVRAIAAAEASILVMTPHLLRALASELRDGERLDHVRAVGTGGEAILGRDVEAFSTHLPPEAVHINTLGSSEATITTAIRLPGGKAPSPDTVPVGRPVRNREIWLVREDGSRAAPGETGQLVIASHYLSGGYYRNPEAHAARFSTLPDGRTAFLQGDLGRIDEDGVLHLAGRADSAVKVRGYLVDLSEVENALRSIPGITDALTIPIAEKGRPTRLIAYVVQAGHMRQDSVAELRRLLRARLSEYMVPSVIVPLAAFPRTERGKIDRQALPQPAEVDVDDTLFTQHELVVQQLWGAVLGLEKVPLSGDFMALGGDSLSVEEMLAEVDARLGVGLGSTDLLGAPTLREFALLLEQREKSVLRVRDYAVLAQGDGRGRLFGFVGAGALALQFLPITRHLEGWDVVAFQAHGLEERARPDWTVEAHARRALAFIRKIQPHGPYHLAGHSFGGLVAHEIASQLQDEGEEVRLLALLDTYLPGSAIDELAVVENFGRLADPEPESWAKRAITAILPRAADKTLSEMSFVRAAAVIARARTAGLLRYRGQRQFDTFFYQSVLAARRYRMRPYFGRAVVVTAPTNSVDPKEWSAILRGEVVYRQVASEHSAMLREPHARELGTLLVDALETSRSVTA